MCLTNLPGSEQTWPGSAYLLRMNVPLSGSVLLISKTFGGSVYRELTPHKYDRLKIAMFLSSDSFSSLSPECGIQ